MTNSEQAPKNEIWKNMGVLVLTLGLVAALGAGLEQLGG